MSVPQKPWESPRFIPYQNANPGVIGSGRNVLHSNAPQPLPYAPTLTTPVTVSQRASVLPPLPQRPQQLFNRPSFGMSAPMFGGYGSYGGYGASSYNGYGNSSFGGMYGLGSYGYGSYPPVGGGFENRFLQVAEESSRDAFQSIESLVRAFASVSMMLESTYYAMYSSFRAVLSVVDNFSRLRQLFAQFLSAITILKVIRQFYRQLLYWFGVLDHSPQAESVWESVGTHTGNERTQPVVSSPKWPLITFIAFLIGGPYLISKFFSSSTTNGSHWDPLKGRYIRTAYPHQAGTHAELSFQANETLNLAPQELQTCQASGWLLASNESGKVGFVPVTRLAVAAASTQQKNYSQTNEAQRTESQ